MTSSMDLAAGPRPPVAVAGAGNWLLTSDRVGPRVLELIGGRYGAEVELCDVGCAGLELLDHMAGQELMLVVDACVRGHRPGRIEVEEPDLSRVTGRECSVHQIGPMEALYIAAKLHPRCLPRRTLLVLVETEGIDQQMLERACQEVVLVLDREIANWRNRRAATSDDGGMNGKP